MQIKAVVVLFAVLIFALGTGYYFGYDRWFERSMSKNIRSFEDCAKAGNPIMESYPRQCRAGGVTFVEVIPQPLEEELIHVTSPIPNARVTSPLVVKGEARGTWYFEASFPVRLLDGNSKELAVVSAQAQGDWMTEDFVPFEVTLTFSKPETDTGTLVLERDNPSGLPEHDKKVSIPVRFK